MKPFLSIPITIHILISLLAFPVSASASSQSPNTITLVSVSSNGVQGNSSSEDPILSANGRFAAFRSPADNLVPSDTNGKIDIFVRDLGTGTNVRISTSSDGSQADGDSYFPALSANGQYVAFISEASNLVPNDTNGFRDIFVHDRDTDRDGIFDEPGAIATVRVSVRTDGTQGSLPGPCGIQCGVLEIPSISGDGRYVAFHSYFPNLVDQDTNDLPDIFVRDRDVSGNGIFDESGDVATYRVSVNSQGVESNGTSIFPIISGDGRSVIFRSAATNLTIGDTNDSDDVFLHNMQTGVTSLISVATDGTQGQGESQEGDISADGHYVLFSSIAANLTAGDTNNAWDAFLRDTQTSETTRVSVASDGNEGNGDSFADSISSDGRLIVFDSSASNLVAGDTNAFKDIFVIIRASTIIRRASINAQGTEGNGDSVSGSVSDDGLTVLFRSNADNLVPNDVNGGPDVFTSEIKLFLPIIIG